MTTEGPESPLADLIARAGAVDAEVQARFGGMSVQQLNWKPGADRWSIAQCLDHLVTANEGYFPVVEQVLRGSLPRTFWTRLPWLPGLWGRILIKAVSPQTSRKSKAPRIFQPATSSIDGAIVRRFHDTQEQTIRHLRASAHLELERIVVPSPVTPLITYRLMDAYRIVVLHEERHLLQARRVSEADGFPR